MAHYHGSAQRTSRTMRGSAGRSRATLPMRSHYVSILNDNENEKRNRNNGIASFCFTLWFCCLFVGSPFLDYSRS